jgi:hypothetical protein
VGRQVGRWAGLWSFSGTLEYLSILAGTNGSYELDCGWHEATICTSAIDEPAGMASHGWARADGWEAWTTATAATDLRAEAGHGWGEDEAKEPDSTSTISDEYRQEADSTIR